MGQTRSFGPLEGPSGLDSRQSAPRLQSSSVEDKLDRKIFFTHFYDSFFRLLCRGKALFTHSARRNRAWDETDAASACTGRAGASGYRPCRQLSYVGSPSRRQDRGRSDGWIFSKHENMTLAEEEAFAGALRQTSRR